MARTYTSPRRKVLNQNISQQQLYYLAGAIDTGGNFTLERQKSPHLSAQYIWNAEIVFSCSDENYMKTLCSILFAEGSIYIERTVTKSTGLPSCRLQIGGPTLGQLLSLVIDKLIAKKELAKLFIEFRDTIQPAYRNQGLPSEVEDKRSAIMERYLDINRARYARKSTKLA
jgi:hypothetical protein